MLDAYGVLHLKCSTSADQVTPNTSNVVSSGKTLTLSLRDWAVETKALSSYQKGFLPCNGCIEHKRNTVGGFRGGGGS